MGCTLAQALEMGKSICPVCIGTDCIYINGIVREPETGQLLISADTCTSVSCVDPISGAYIDVSAMDAVSTGLNSWDEAMLSSAAAVAGGMPLRVDTCELNIACDAGDSTAVTEWTDAGGRHLRLLFEGVTEEEAVSLELSIAGTERFYCLWDDLLFVRSAPAVEARFVPLSDALNYVYDDTGNYARFAPGNMLEAWDWTQAAAVELSWAIEGMNADAHIALYSLDAISGSADDMVILEARTPANVTIRRTLAARPASVWACAPRATNWSTPPSFPARRQRPCMKTRRCWVLRKRLWSAPTDAASHKGSRPRPGGGFLQPFAMRTSRSCISAITASATSRKTGKRPMLMWSAISPNSGGISSVPT